MTNHNLVKYVLIIALTIMLSACKEEPSSPATNPAGTEKASAAGVTYNVKIGSTSSATALTPGNVNSQQLNPLSLTATSTISAATGSGAITYSAPGAEKNSYLPTTISANSSYVSRTFDGVTKSKPIDQYTRDFLNLVQQHRTTSALRKTTATNWGTMTPAQITAAFQSKGYSVTAIDAQRYQLTRQFQPLNNGQAYTIKMVFNAATGISENAELSQNGQKVSEDVLVQSSGKTTSHGKVFGQTGKRSNKNFVISRNIN